LCKVPFSIINTKEPKKGQRNIKEAERECKKYKKHKPNICGLKKSLIEWYNGYKWKGD
jgi:hypothetical protein